MCRIFWKTPLQFRISIPVKNLDLELDLAVDSKGSSEVNTGQLCISMNGIENVNMANYPRQTSSNSNAGAAAALAGASSPGSSQSPANR